MKIENAVVLITGASSGIGRAICLAFDRAGARVAMAARRRERLEENAAAMKQALVLPTDLSDEQQARDMVRKTVERFGRIDILVNNAAAIIVSRADELNPEDMVRSFRTNVIGPASATAEAAPHMRRQGYGHIINVGSPGFMIGLPLYAPYVCSKAAMCAWTRTLQAEWYGSGIEVSEYFPGYIKTDSPAESAYGEVGQDIFMDPDQNAIAGFFTRPKSVEHVAAQIVKIAKKPRLLTYSGASGAFGAWLTNIPGIRRRIAVSMAHTARKKLGLGMFRD